MTKREARAYVLRVLSVEVRHHLDNGSEWLERPLRADGIAVDADGAFSNADQERIAEAVLEIADSLERRAARLAVRATKGSAR